MTKEPKKDVNACIDFIYTMVKGHFLSSACSLFGVSSLDTPPILPPGTHTASAAEKLAIIMKISWMVVEHCSLIEGSLTNEAVVDKEDGVYNYARILCHFGSLVMELRDAWQERDGQVLETVSTSFKAAGYTKYSLEALKLQIHSGIICSPNIAHQITWNRFVNVRGGAATNIPCDLFNKHINKQLKYIITNMGSNLTESALQRAAWSVTSLHQICEKFDIQSGVPCRTTAHSTRPDKEDVKKVVSIVLRNKLLVEIGHREHRSFQN